MVVGEVSTVINDVDFVPVDGTKSATSTLRTLKSQVSLLWRLFWKERIGNWKLSLLELVFPIYPLLFFVFLVKTDLFPYERLEFDAVSSYPEIDLNNISALALAAWSFNPSLIGFAPSGDAASMDYAVKICNRLGLNFSSVSLFENAVAVEEARTSDIQAVVIFDEEEPGSYTLVHRDFQDLLFGLTLLNPDRDPRLPPLTESEAILNAGVVKLQAVTSQVVLEEHGVDFGTEGVNFNVQMLPDEFSVSTRNFMEFVFPLMFIGALFFSMRSLIFGMTLQAEKGIREALELKGMDRRAMWVAALLCYFTSTMLSVIVLVPLVYAIGFLSSVSFGNFFGLFVLFAWAQTCFGIMMVSFAGDKPNSKQVFVGVIFLFIIFQFTYIIFQALVVPRDWENSKVRALFLIYMVPFGNVMSIVTEAELLNADLSTDLDDNVFAAYIMLFVDGVIYFCIGICWDAFKMYRKRVQFSHKQDVSKVDVEEGANTRGIVIRNLVKEFTVPLTKEELEVEEQSSNWITKNVLHRVKPPKKILKAVNELSLNVKENEIFCLLGHNGAGKTTTFNTLIGSLAATSGDAWIHGLNITKDRDKLRTSLGVCPQFDIVMEGVKAKDQLIFQAQLSGLSKEDSEKEAQRLLKALELEFKANEYASNMSGGQKRRLTLALALIGSPAVIVLDEPTTGLDPNNRRHVWKLLQELKKKHTIVMTTHSLEEADALADTIAIMADGKLEVIGSSLELKRDHGSGYRLTCLRYENQSEYDATQLHDNVSRYINDAKIISNIGAEVSFALPTEQSSKFPELFEYLENNADSFGIENFGLSPTTLEDVFLNLDVKLHEEEPDVSQAKEGKIPVEKEKENTNTSVQELENDCQISTGRQFRNIMYYTALMILRHPVTFGFLIIYPVLFTIIFVYVNRLLQPDPPVAETISFADQFSGKGKIHFSANGTQQNIVKSVIGLDVVGNSFNTSEELYQFLGDTRNGQIGGYAFSDIQQNGASFNVSSTLMFEQANAFSNPVLVQELFSGFASVANVSDISVSYLHWQSEFLANDIFGGGGLTYLIAVALATQGTHFTLQMMFMRKSGTKQMLLLSGLPRWIFWLAHFICHLFIVLVPCIAVYFVLLGYGEAGATDTNGFAFIGLFICFGLPTILFGYVFSFAFDDEEAAQQFSAETANVMLLVPWVLVNFVFEEPILWLENLLTLFIPGFGVYRGLALIATADANGEPFSFADIFVWDNVLIQVYFFLLLGALFYTFILFSIESNLKARFTKWSNDRKIRKHVAVNGEEETTFSQQVEDNLQLVRKGILPAPISAIPEDVPKDDLKIVCNDVNKRFLLNDKSVFKAVNNASLGVVGNSVFGLLGPNGAGKTTLIKCITGLDGQVMDSGNAKIGGYDTVSERTKVLPLMGICPQFDALIGLLTGREILSLFAGVRGVKPGNIKPLVNHYLTMLDLVPKADARCETLSGGNKRRLSVAMSMIGSPRSLFLDEPTTGLDPTTRRKVWKFLQLASQHGDGQTGRGILLTTHSMEEADALCSRIAIMVSSSIRTVGTSQQLKTRYSTGTLVTVGINNKSDHAGIMGLMKEINPDAFLQDESMTNLKYLLPENRGSWSKIFKSLLRRQQDLGIVDFAVSQRSLEDVFIEFANLQPGEEN